MREGTVVLASATVDPGFLQGWEARLAERGVLLIDAPVSGGPKRAAEGDLVVMASGPPEAFARVDAILPVVVGRVYRLGDAVGIASTIKMINQHLAGVHIAVACEAMALGMRAGADPRQLYEVISDSAGSSWMFQNRVPHILEGNYAPASRVDIFVKDLGIVLENAARLGFDAPLASAAFDVYLAAAAKGFGGDDDSSLIKVYAEQSGVTLPGPVEQAG
jgi:3-hydroxyisobutyrate dehydrogenase